MTPDMQTVMFKILKYSDDCLKAGVEPDLDEARKLAGVNNVFFVQIMAEADRKGFVSGLYFPKNIDTSEPRVFANHMALTFDGADYLRDNSSMQKTASLLGTAAKTAIDAAVNATVKAALGL